MARTPLLPYSQLHRVLAKPVILLKPLLPFHLSFHRSFSKSMKISRYCTKDSGYSEIPEPTGTTAAALLYRVYKTSLGLLFIPHCCCIMCHIVMLMMLSHTCTTTLMTMRDTHDNGILGQFIPLSLHTL